jgi:hypothetical protein
LSSEHSNRDIPWCSSKFFIEKTFRTKVRGMDRHAKALQQDICVMKSGILEEVGVMRTVVLDALNKIYYQFSK